jgi:hypothetical protein
MWLRGKVHPSAAKAKAVFDASIGTAEAEPFQNDDSSFSCVCPRRRGSAAQRAI